MKKSEAEDLRAWDQYQHSKIGNNVEERIKLFDLEKYSSTEWTMLDTGANNGKFTAQLAHLFKHCTGLEPYAEPVQQPDNVTWIKQGFKEFCKNNTEQFDVVYSFAMTIQVEDIDGLDTNTIADYYFNLTRNNGIVIYETQKLSKPRHAEHANRMIQSFRKKFGEEFLIGKGRSRDKRTVHYFKKNV
jgi:2-polyprenyl-3-methyl-5-hydroxy-6-metoxy-1,4-benzoquinol methylase